MMHYWGYGHGMFFWPGFGFIGLIVPILFWVLIIGLIVSLFRHGDWSNEEKPAKKTDDQNNSNLEIVKKRYASGEIDKKEYEQLKRDLA